MNPDRAPFAAAAMIRAFLPPAEVPGVPEAINIRIGGSDARGCRMAARAPAVLGPTPHSMRGADEGAEIAELRAAAEVHALAGFHLPAA